MFPDLRVDFRVHFQFGSAWSQTEAHHHQEQIWTAATAEHSFSWHSNLGWYKTKNCWDGRHQVLLPCLNFYCWNLNVDCFQYIRFMSFRIYLDWNCYSCCQIHLFTSCLSHNLNFIIERINLNFENLLSGSCCCQNQSQFDFCLVYTFIGLLISVSSVLTLPWGLRQNKEIGFSFLVSCFGRMFICTCSCVWRPLGCREVAFHWNLWFAYCFPDLSPFCIFMVSRVFLVLIGCCVVIGGNSLAQRSAVESAFHCLRCCSPSRCPIIFSDWDWTCWSANSWTRWSRRTATSCHSRRRLGGLLRSHSTSLWWTWPGGRVWICSCLSWSWSARSALRPRCQLHLRFQMRSLDSDCKVSCLCGWSQESARCSDVFWFWFGHRFPNAGQGNLHLMKAFSCAWLSALKWSSLFSDILCVRQSHLRKFRFAKASRCCRCCCYSKSAMCSANCFRRFNYAAASWSADSLVSISQEPVLLRLWNWFSDLV